MLRKSPRSWIYLMGEISVKENYRTVKTSTRTSHQNKPSARTGQLGSGTAVLKMAQPPFLECRGPHKALGYGMADRKGVSSLTGYNTRNLSSERHSLYSRQQNKVSKT
jgi:hypothetical protein